MRLVLTGGTGLVGHFLLAEALAAGDRVTLLGRTPHPACAHMPWSLDTPAPDLSGHDALIHCAFDHVPGRYRGGEGDDPAGFTARNLDGTRRLFDAAAAAGLTQIVFLSSRAVLSGDPPGTTLTEDMSPSPDTLYGEVKAGAEAHLAALPLTGTALRATGIYGPATGGRAHKWAGLFADYLSGRPIAPRRGTELHGQDLATAFRLCLTHDLAGVVHASDITLDRHDLLTEVQTLTGCPHPPPARSAAPVSALDCTKLRALGWHPGGWAKLRASLPDLLA